MKLPKDTHIVSENLHFQLNKVLTSAQYSCFNNFTVRDFEFAFSKKFQTPSLAVTNCTNALEAVFRTLNLKGEIIVPAYGYMALVQAVKNAGCTPVFVDIDDTFTIDPDKINITEKTAAIVPVHLFGNPANMTKLFKISKEEHIPLIEDCAHALGARFAGKYVGNFGIGCHSFGETKMLRIGEGGVVTASKAFLDKFRIYCHEGEMLHGRSTMDLFSEADFMDFDNLTYSDRGSNLRMSPFLAAIGLAKLEEFQDHVRALERNSRYLMRKLPFQFAVESGERVFSSLPCIVPERDKFLYLLAKEGVPVGRYFPALTSLPQADFFARNHMLLPHYETLNEEHLAWIVEKMKEVLENMENTENTSIDYSCKIKDFYSFNLFTL